jgi:hypothetical protein
MYGNRLVRAYFGTARRKRKPHWFTNFDFDDNVCMAELENGWCAVEARPGSADDKTEKRKRLLHVVNMALNLVSATDKRLAWQQRKAASFTVSRLHAGSDVVRFLECSDHYRITLGRAMTISGAAASSNMGYHSSRPVALVMTFFNVRLGWWLPNPRHKHKLSKRPSDDREPKWALRPLWWEALSSINEHRPYLYLSDGGHFDNLGLYEMVRRGCRRILVVDASSDPKCAYNDLQDVMRKIRVDFGISIAFGPKALDKPRRCVMGHIHYRDGAKGSLYYLKPALCGDEPLDLLNYAQESRLRNPKSPFPHQSTGDQFFDEAQFESYRLLGFHTVKNLWAEDGTWPDECSLARYERTVAAYVSTDQNSKPGNKPADAESGNGKSAAGASVFSRSLRRLKVSRPG